MTYNKLPNSKNRKRRNFHIDDAIFYPAYNMSRSKGISMAGLIEYMLTTINKKTIESAKKYLASL